MLNLAEYWIAPITIKSKLFWDSTAVNSKEYFKNNKYNANLYKLTVG